MFSKNKVSNIFFILSTILLFLGFYRNQWLVVLPGRFREFQKDSQALVMGRLIVSRQSGMFSYGALLGKVNVAPDERGDEMDTRQYELYLKEKEYSTYTIYPSQSGIQGLFFSLLDHLSPFPSIENMRLYRIITSMALAIVLSIFLHWTLKEFGLIPALICLLTTIASPWLTVFGRNLFYVTAFFYLPMSALIFFMSKNKEFTKQVKQRFGVLIFATVLLKCLFNGYDFILPSIGMLIVPFFYYSIRDKWKLKDFFLRGLILAVSTGIGILTSLMVLASQLSFVLGGWDKAATYILDTFSRRTLGNPEKFPSYADSLQANVFDVLKIYFTGNESIARFEISFSTIIAVFFILSFIYMLVKFLSKSLDEDANSGKALLITTWVSFTIPILWFVIFKGQAYGHPHTNFLSWYMPFTLLGFTWCGYVLQYLAKLIWRPRG